MLELILCLLLVINYGPDEANLESHKFFAKGSTIRVVIDSDIVCAEMNGYFLGCSPRA